MECVANGDCSGSTPFCDSGSNTCRAGIWSYSAKFGTAGSGNSNLNGPRGIAVSPDTLTAWVVDMANSRIVVWTRPDATSTTWSYSAQFGTSGSGNSNFNTPLGIVVSPDTLTAWVADYSNNRISIWTRPDATSTTWSYSAKFGTQGSGDSNLKTPASVFVSADTLTAWVADNGNNRIVIWTRPDTSSTTWSYSTQFGTQGTGDSNFDLPVGIAVSLDTLTAWVTDLGNSRTVVWTRPDTSSTTWSYNAKFGTAGSGNSNLALPRPGCASPDTLTTWVADFGNARIVAWTRPDATSTTWSYSAKFGSGPGSGDSNFDRPQGVVVSADSLTAWVADYGNNRISIWTQS